MRKESESAKLRQFWQNLVGLEHILWQKQTPLTFGQKRDSKLITEAIRIAPTVLLRM